MAIAVGVLVVVVMLLAGARMRTTPPFGPGQGSDPGKFRDE